MPGTGEELKHDSAGEVNLSVPPVRGHEQYPPAVAAGRARARADPSVSTPSASATV